MNAPVTAAPPRVVVVGAGIVGLSIACALLDEGAQVTLVEKETVGAGASWGNAGFVTPELMAPLPEPAVFGQALRAFFDPRFPVHIPLVMPPRLLRFLLGFARNSFPGAWSRGMRSFDALRAASLDAYDGLLAAGLPEGSVVETEPLIVGFSDVRKRDSYLRSLTGSVPAREGVGFEAVGGADARRQEPVLGESVRAAILVSGQRMVDPPRLLDALKALVESRGGTIVERAEVIALHERGSEVVVEIGSGQMLTADQVVLSTGAESPRLGHSVGVRTPIVAGRGYSFRVDCSPPVEHALYIPGQRIACIPVRDGFRIAGIMEFLSTEAPRRSRQIELMVEAASAVFTGIDWSTRTDEWVGSRPCTVDGLPLIGRTRSPRVHIATGHAMWGMVLGPLTGRLIADVVFDREERPELRALDPLR